MQNYYELHRCKEHGLCQFFVQGQIKLCLQCIIKAYLTEKVTMHDAGLEPIVRPI